MDKVENVSVATQNVCPYAVNVMGVKERETPNETRGIEIVNKAMRGMRKNTIRTLFSPANVIFPRSFLPTASS